MKSFLFLLFTSVAQAQVQQCTGTITKLYVDKDRNVGTEMRQKLLFSRDADRANLFSSYWRGNKYWVIDKERTITLKGMFVKTKLLKDPNARYHELSVWAYPEILHVRCFEGT